MENTSSASKKFMKAEGGSRTYRMDAKRTERTGSRQTERRQQKSCTVLITSHDMIGDETVATDPETLVEFLTEKGHPALGHGPDDVI